MVDILLIRLTTVKLSASKLRINLQTLMVFLINFRFPHLSLFSLLLMDAVRSLVPYAHVRASAVVESDEAADVFQSIFICRKTSFLAVYALALDDAVHTLGNAVVGGLVVLGHRYQDAVLLQLLHIQVAAVLHTAVGVVDESREVVPSGLFYCHAECLEGENSRKRIGQAPAHNLVRVGIRDQVQVAASVLKIDVGDVAHPQLVGACRDEAFDKVLPLVVSVVGVRRGACPAGLQH